MSFINLLILGIVAWRITYMLTHEEGPYDIFLRLREKAQKYPFSPLHCFYCASFWVAGPLVFFSDIHFLIAGAAISAVAIFINIIHDRLLD